MNLHEYQGKSILKKYGVAVPLGFVAESPENARELAKKILDERVETRRAKGRDVASVAVTPSEPEAMIQTQKDKTSAPSYKPSVAVNADRVIVGHGVDPVA